MSPEMGIWLLIVVWAAAMAFGAVEVHRFWRDARSVRAWIGVPAWWPLGDALWRGTVRSCALWVTLGSVAAVTLAMAEATGWRRDPASLGGLGSAFVATLSVVILALLGLFASVALFNRPRFVVPPHLRSEPSAVAEWAAATRRWRARVEGQPAILKPMLFLVFVLTGETIGARRRHDAGRARHSGER